MLDCVPCPNGRGKAGMMAQGQRLTDEQVETIRAVFSEGGSLGDAARAAACSKNSARKYAPPPDDNLAQLRTEKKADIISRIAEVRSMWLEHLAEEDVIAKADGRESVIVFGTLTDKHQLMTGAATSRTETGPPDSGRFTLDEIEKLAAVAERVKGGAS